jgi:co-chaperonin GroES (HSP10)
MEQSRYLSRFNALTEVKSTFELIGDCLLVEKIKEEDLIKKGSLYIPISSKMSAREGFNENRPSFVRVLAVGEGYYDPETKASVPLNVQAGDIILIGALSVKWFSLFGAMEGYETETIGLTRESEIQLRFKGEDGFKKVFETLNGRREEKREGA